MVDFFSSWIIFPEFSPERLEKGGKVFSDSGDSGKKRPARHNLTPILLLIGTYETRDYLSTLLAENSYLPILVKDQKDLLRSIQQRESATILIDCSAVKIYGVRILSKIKVACQDCRIIMFCDKAHLCDEPHRNLIKEILNIGVYACILTPCQDWEILNMISYYPPR